MYVSANLICTDKVTSLPLVCNAHCFLPSLSLFLSLSIMSFSSLTSPLSLHHSLSLSAPFPFLSHTLRLLVVLLFFSLWVCARSVALRSCSTGDSLLSSAFIRSAKSAPVLIQPVHPLLPDSVLTPLADKLSGRALYARIGTLASDCVTAYGCACICMCAHFL